MAGSLEYDFGPEVDHDWPSSPAIHSIAGRSAARGGGAYPTSSPAGISSSTAAGLTVAGGGSDPLDLHDPYSTSSNAYLASPSLTLHPIQLQHGHVDHASLSAHAELAPPPSTASTALALNPSLVALGRPDRPVERVSEAGAYDPAVISATPTSAAVGSGVAPVGALDMGGDGVASGSAPTDPVDSLPVKRKRGRPKGVRDRPDRPLKPGQTSLPKRGRPRKPPVPPPPPKPRGRPRKVQPVTAEEVAQDEAAREARRVKREEAKRAEEDRRRARRENGLAEVSEGEEERRRIKRDKARAARERKRSEALGSSTATMNSTGDTYSNYEDGSLQAYGPSSRPDDGSLTDDLNNPLRFYHPAEHHDLPRGPDFGAEPSSFFSIGHAEETADNVDPSLAYSQLASADAHGMAGAGFGQHD